MNDAIIRHQQAIAEIKEHRIVSLGGDYKIQKMVENKWQDITDWGFGRLNNE